MLALPLLAFIPLALAAGNSPGWTTGAESDADNSEAYYASVKSSYNATGHAAVRGVTITQPFSAGLGDVPWSLDVYVKGGLKLSSDSSLKDGVYRTTASIELTANDGVRGTQMDPSWSICNAVFRGMPGNKGNKATNGSCDGLFSDCVLQGTDSYGCPYLSVKKTSDCQFNSTAFWAMTSTDQFQVVNASAEHRLAANRTDSLIWRSVVDVHSNATDFRDYDYLTEIFYAVPLHFMAANNKTHNPTALVKPDDGWVCLQADSFAKGSRINHVSIAVGLGSGSAVVFACFAAAVASILSLSF